MNVLRQAVKLTRQLLVLAAAAAGLSQAAVAQVGLTSGLAQVALVARVAPRGTVNSVTTPMEQKQGGRVHDLSVMVNVSANAPYRLMVRRSDVAADRVSRVWVRGSDGEFQPLQQDSRIVVARGTHSLGDSQQEIRYRIETTDTMLTPVKAVPARYEMMIDSNP